MSQQTRAQGRTLPSLDPISALSFMNGGASISPVLSRKGKDVYSRADGSDPKASSAAVSHLTCLSLSFSFVKRQKRCNQQLSIVTRSQEHGDNEDS